MKLTIDRIEEDFAVCEDENKNMLNIKLSEIPFEVNEGDIIGLSENSFTRLEKETALCKKDLEKRFKGLFE
ncbi:MAG: DUF3006 domain-containing protein [Lachnospiraceae bacterium]|nr:DUF3006 domain-containing protein [Lachnospiraceae bacterium]